MTYLWLLMAICSEVLATSMLKAAESFTRPLPSVIVVLGYGFSFYCLSQALKTMPVGIAYAIWSGIGTVMIALVGLFFYHQTLDRAALLGISMIVAGVAILDFFSKSATQ
jgi:small multidrug resistance pump